MRLVYLNDNSMSDQKGSSIVQTTESINNKTREVITQDSQSTKRYSMSPVLE